MNVRKSKVSFSKSMCTQQNLFLVPTNAKELINVKIRQSTPQYTLRDAESMEYHALANLLRLIVVYAEIRGTILSNECKAPICL